MNTSQSTQHSNLRVLVVMGTRPEAIKMAPLVHACQHRAELEPIVCLTGQHREMLRQVTDYFGIDAEVNLDLMRPNQSLASLTARLLESLDESPGRSPCNTIFDIISD